MGSVIVIIFAGLSRLCIIYVYARGRCIERRGCCVADSADAGATCYLLWVVIVISHYFLWVVMDLCGSFSDIAS